MLTVVTGPPCSGKTTHVHQRAQPGDIVVDYDQLAQALGSPHSHDHPHDVAAVTRAARDAAVKAALAAHRRGATVWIIDTDPPTARRRTYHRAGATLITLTADRAELHRRAHQAGRPRRWHAVIDEWLAAHRDDQQPEGTDLEQGGIRPW